jgi:tetratricopeptide (TPR) repeat protein
VAYAEASAWQVQALRSLGRLEETRRIAEEAERVARQVLERRPGHMGAVRSHTLAIDSLANAESDDLHVRKALDLYQQSIAGWETLLKLDPSNQIAWNNLSNARTGLASSLWALGRIDASVAQWHSALAVEQRAKQAGFIALPLALASGYLAMLEADAGRRDAAAAALATNARVIDLAMRDLAAGSFERTLIPEFLGNYGYPTTGPGYGAIALPYTAGDYEAVRAVARASIARLEALKSPDPQRELDVNRLLWQAYRTQAEASYRLKEYPAAEQAIQRALAIGRQIPQRTLAERRDASLERMLAAMIAARVGRPAEAQKLIEPVLKFQHALYARGKDNEDLFQHVEFARALYVASLAGAGQRAAQLTEAAAILSGLPPEMNRLITTTRLRDEIAEEQKRVH